MAKFLSGFSTGTTVLLSLSIMLFAGFLMTRLTRLLKLPYVSAYIISGVLLGPKMLGVIPVRVIDNMVFLNDLALAFIAFNIGRFFKRDVIREAGPKIVAITLFENLLSGLLITVIARFIFNLPTDFSLLLGAIATATSPASTMMIVDQYHARGPFVNTMLQVVALDNVISLFSFSIVSGIIAVTSKGDAVSFGSVAMPIIYNIAAIILGLLCGIILSKILTPRRSRDNRLILTIALLLGISGLCAIFDVSPLLSCMVFGATYINAKNDKELYRQIRSFTPPIFCLFFMLSGMKLDVTSLGSVGLMGFSYFLFRIIGKYVGSYLGCSITRYDQTVKKYLGLSLVPQAGVAIGLGFLGQRLLPAEMGDMLLAIILSAGLLFEIIGPACSKAALSYSGAIRKDTPIIPASDIPTAAELLTSNGNSDEEDEGSAQLDLPGCAGDALENPEEK